MSKVLRIEGKSIEITRGDSVRFMIRLKNRELADGTQALFTVKGTPWEPARPEIEKLIDVVDGMVSVVLEPYETDLTPGHYVWDLRVKEPAADGRTDVLTPMEYAAFKVREAIGE